MHFQFFGKETVIVNGVFRSGTNLVKHVLEENFPVRVLFNKHWWKHLPPPHSAETRQIIERTKVVIVVRNPIAWSNSIYNFFLARRPDLYPSDLSYSEFIERKAFIFDSTKKVKALPRYVYPNIFDYYNNYYLTWLSLSSQPNVKILDLDWLKNNPDMLLDIFPDSKEIKRAIKIPANSVLPSSDRTRSALGESTSAFVSDDFASFDKSKILDRIDNDIIDAFSYSLDQAF